MSTREMCLDRIDRCIRAVEKRYNFPASPERMREVGVKLRELECKRELVELEPLRGKKVFLGESRSITDNLPNAICFSGMTIVSETKLPQNLAQVLLEGEFDGAVVHLASTSSTDWLRVMMNRILEAGSGTSVKIVVLLGNHSNTNFDRETIHRLFDSVGVKYVKKYSGHYLQEGFSLLADMFDEES